MPGYTASGEGSAIWIAVFALCLIGVATGFLGLLFPRLARLSLLRRCWIGLVSLLGVVQLLELLALAQTHLEGSPLFLARFGILLAGLWVLVPFRRASGS